MRLSILAVGRLKAAPEQSLAADYLNRAGKLGRVLGIQSISMTEIAESKAATAALRQRQESERLLSALPPAARAIVLDERADQLTSLEFAAELRRMLEASTKHLAFLIGGADGHAPLVAARADRRLSLGAMTWPHALIRLMLAEQIYRSVTILINHPYHRP